MAASAWSCREASRRGSPFPGCATANSSARRRHPLHAEIREESGERRPERAELERSPSIPTKNEQYAERREAATLDRRKLPTRESRSRRAAERQMTSAAAGTDGVAARATSGSRFNFASRQSPDEPYLFFSRVYVKAHSRDRAEMFGTSAGCPVSSMQIHFQRSPGTARAWALPRNGFRFRKGTMRNNIFKNSRERLLCALGFSTRRLSAPAAGRDAADCRMRRSHASDVTGSISRPQERRVGVGLGSSGLRLPVASATRPAAAARRGSTPCGRPIGRPKRGATVVHQIELD